MQANQSWFAPLAQKLIVLFLILKFCQSFQGGPHNFGWKLSCDRTIPPALPEENSEKKRVRKCLFPRFESSALSPD